MPTDTMKREEAVTASDTERTISSSVATGRTPLGRRLREIRRDIVASGTPLIDWAELEREMDDIRRRRLDS